MKFAELKRKVKALGGRAAVIRMKDGTSIRGRVATDAGGSPVLVEDSARRQSTRTVILTCHRFADLPEPHVLSTIAHCAVIGAKGTVQPGVGARRECSLKPLRLLRKRFWAELKLQL